MSESEQETQQQSSGVSLNDVLFMLFKHKWKLMLCATIGVGAAIAIYFLSPSVYESEAKLLVRYVVDKSAVDAIDASVKTPNAQSLNLINSEVEILTSWDLAMQVVDAIGVERLAGGPRTQADKVGAARDILRALSVSALKDTNIIVVSYRNADPELAVRVLQELVTRYFDKHLEVHRSVGAFDFVTRETNQLRTRLNQTEEELKRLKAKAGVISLPETTASLNTELAKSQEGLNAAEADLAGQQARVKELERYLAGADAGREENAARRPSDDAIQDYQSLVNRVAHLRETEMSLLSRYTPENRIVKVTQAQIADLESQRRSMEQRFPGLAAMVITPATPGQPARPDLVSEKARLVAIEAQTNTLRSRVAALQDQAKVLSELGPQIAELQRRRDVEEANYKYFEASLEKARIDETLDPSRMPNISVVQKPSSAQKATRDVKKVVLGLAGGGIGFGVAIALLIEMVLDRTVKRPLELETRLHIPVLLSIPYFGRNGQLRLRANNSDPDEAGIHDGDGSSLDPWEENHFIRPFCEALRDRLIFDFELSKMAHKPKLVAVTSCTDGAGASTLAVGVATALSDTCDGKVLLVDKQFDPRRFYDLIAEFKASDFDYIIFDMPSLTNGAATLAMAGLMDKVVLVVEAGKSNRDTVKRAFAKLAAAKAKVVTVFNKTRSYGPKWLETEV
jgi:succinoglycan biosynthesis transport protein ExoP